VPSLRLDKGLLRLELYQFDPRGNLGRGSGEHDASPDYSALAYSGRVFQKVFRVIAVAPPGGELLLAGRRQLDLGVGQLQRKIRRLCDFTLRELPLISAAHFKRPLRFEGQGPLRPELAEFGGARLRGLRSQATPPFEPRDR